METFEGNGVFWLPEHPDLKLAGHFSFDPKSGANLELIGGILGDFGGALSSEVDSTTLCGVIPGKRLVMLFAIQNGMTVGSETASERYKSLLVLEGTDWETLNRPSFEEVEIELDLLPDWVGSPKFEFQHQPRSETTPEIISAALNPKPREEASEAGLQVTLESRWRQSSDKLERVEMTQQFVLSIVYSVERDIQDVLEDVGHVQSLISIAMDSPCTLKRVTGYRKDLKRTLGDEEYPQPIDIYIRQRYIPTADESNSARVMMGFEPLGGLPTIVRWIQSARRQRPVIGGLLSIRNMPGIFLENRYDNVVGAAETFHRINFDNHVRPQHEYDAIVTTIVERTDAEHQNWIRGILTHGNEPRLRQRLSEMCDYVSPVMTELVGETDRWAKVVAALRNRLTHHDDTIAFDWEPADALWLCDSIYILVATSLLVTSEVEPNTLMSLFGSPRIMSLKATLPAVIERLFAQI